MRKLVCSILLLLIVSAVNAQSHIPEEVRILQYVKKHHPGAEPQLSGLYVIKSKTTKGALASAGNEVTVHYEGKFLNEQIFDSSYNRGNPITFTLGTGKVIAGWEMALSQMNEGEKATLIVPSYLGYGEKGAGKIPPKTPLVFIVELLKVRK